MIHFIDGESSGEILTDDKPLCNERHPGVGVRGAGNAGRVSCPVCRAILYARDTAAGWEDDEAKIMNPGPDYIIPSLVREFFDAKADPGILAGDVINAWDTLTKTEATADQWRRVERLTGEIIERVKAIREVLKHG
jgi:uncharacterized Zn finger protein (UPF0148 family)